MTDKLAYIFAGPSVGTINRKGVLFLPPIKRGDIYQILHHRPYAIGIIDGYFDQNPAIAHKEILEAIASGTRVFGASSMGALRAAELNNHGMEGVGKIYDWYQSGRLTEDDAVAVLHGPAEFRYPLFTFPLVDFLATLEKLLECGMMPKSAATFLFQEVAQLNYRDRTQKTLKELLIKNDLSEYFRIIEQNWVFQKKIDAEELVNKIDKIDGHNLPVEHLPPLTTWVAHHIENADLHIDDLPLQVFAAFAQLSSDHFPETYQEFLMNLALSRFLPSGEAANELIESRYISRALGYRICDVKSRARECFAQYKKKWPGVELKEVVGAAMMLPPGASFSDLLEMPPCEMPCEVSDLTTLCNCPSTILALAFYLTSEHAAPTLKKARLAMRTCKKEIKEVLAHDQEYLSGAVKWQMDGDNEGDFLKFCRARAINNQQTFMKYNAILELFDKKNYKRKKPSIRRKYEENI